MDGHFKVLNKFKSITQMQKMQKGFVAKPLLPFLAFRNSNDFHIDFMKNQIQFYKGADPVVTLFFFNHEMVIDVIIAFLLALYMIPVLRLML